MRSARTTGIAFGPTVYAQTGRPCPRWVPSGHQFRIGRVRACLRTRRDCRINDYFSLRRPAAAAWSCAKERQVVKWLRNPGVAMIIVVSSAKRMPTITCSNVPCARLFRMCRTKSDRRSFCRLPETGFRARAASAARVARSPSLMKTRAMYSLRTRDPNTVIWNLTLSGISSSENGGGDIGKPAASRSSSEPITECQSEPAVKRSNCAFVRQEPSESSLNRASPAIAVMSESTISLHSRCIRRSPRSASEL